jgi:hypothetical protein
MVVEGFRQGGMWNADAVVVAGVSLVTATVLVATMPLDRRDWMVVGTLSSFALWWLLRSVEVGAAPDFLPLGASILGSAAAFLAIRSLGTAQRRNASAVLVGLGAVGAAIGLVGLIVRWYPMAMPSQGLWRLSTTLTYADAAGLVLAVCLLVALGFTAPTWFIRVSVFLCLAGLVATQSRGPLLAFACACALVPRRQFLVNLVPLGCGLGVGIVAVVTSGSVHPVPWLAVAVAVGSAVSVAWVPELRTPHIGKRQVVVAVAGLFAVSVATVLLVHHQVELRIFSPSNGDRTVEWTAATRQFVSAPLVGVGPDRLLQFTAPDGTYAHFAHNEYLQVAADAGIIGLLILAASVAAVARVVRRVDTATSCAAAALLCCAIAGALDFDWHLPLVGLIVGWTAGTAARRTQ